MAGSMALSDPNTRRQMTKEQIAFLEALVNQAQITHQNKLVRLVLDITPAMLNAAPIQSRRAGAFARQPFIPSRTKRKCTPRAKSRDNAEKITA